MPGVVKMRVNVVVDVRVGTFVELDWAAEAEAEAEAKAGLRLRLRLRPRAEG